MAPFQGGDHALNGSEVLDHPPIQAEGSSALSLTG
jgi:hypothetical protein